MMGRGAQLSSIPPSVPFSFPRIFDGSLEFNALNEEGMNKVKIKPRTGIQLGNLP